MNRYITLFGTACILALFTIALLQYNSSSNTEAEKTSIEKLYPSEDYFMLKQYPESTFHINAYENALKEAYRFTDVSVHRSPGEWVVQGPGNIGARANCIAVNPKDPNHMLIGFSEGGLFLTKNGGSSWRPVFDDKIKLSIGDIEFNPLNPDIIYAGTGDPNVSGYPFIGDGLYKSCDGGETWEYSGLAETHIISQIRISRQNPDVMYVSAMGIPFIKNTNRGVYKSNDGGKSWKNILQINDSTGVSDLVIHPQNHNIVFATGWNRIRSNKKSLVSGPDARIFRSLDGGLSWEKLQGGLPADASSRIGIDISYSNPNILYACYAHPTNFNLKGIYRSEDGGNSWNSLPVGQGSGVEPGIYGGFGWYFGKIRINPENPDDVFLLAVDLYRSKDGGKSWTSAAPPWWTYEVHADKHDLVFNNNTIYLTTDGGAYRSPVASVAWTDIENIATTQFYRVGINPHEPELYYGGAQDNGTSGGNQATIDAWSRIYGGDGFQPVFHPTNKDIFYAETQNGGIVVTRDGGQNFSGATEGIASADPRNWDMPLMMSYHNSEVLYAATDRVYRNTTGADVLWKPVSGNLTDPASDFLRHNISTFHESPVNPDQLAAGTSDGLVWVSKNGGASWDKVSGNLPVRYVSCVQFSPGGNLYVAYTGYRDNDNTPYLYMSDDLGKTWRSFQGDLPKVAINNVLILPMDQDIVDRVIVVATDAGVFYSAYAGQEWFRMGNNMPFVPVYDVDYNPLTNKLVAGTFGRGIQSFDLSQIGYGLVNTNEEQSSAEVRLKSNIILPGQSLEFTNGGHEEVLYTIINSQGQVIRSGKTERHQTTICPGIMPAGIYYFSTFSRKKGKPNTQRFFCY
jgi:photosystem II stability/assembly factor-like uncharacterized protein